MPSTSLESERAAFERRLQHVHEQPVGEQVPRRCCKAAASSGLRRSMTTSSANIRSAIVTRKPSSRYSAIAAAVMATTARRAARRSNRARRTAGSRAPAATARRPNRIDETGEELRHHAGAGQRQAAERQIAAEREDQRAEGRSKRRPRHDRRARSCACPRPAAAVAIHPSTGRSGAPRPRCAWCRRSQNFANSG